MNAKENAEVYDDPFLKSSFVTLSGSSAGEQEVSHAKSQPREGREKWRGSVLWLRNVVSAECTNRRTNTVLSARACVHSYCSEKDTRMIDF